MVKVPTSDSPITFDAINNLFVQQFHWRAYVLSRPHVCNNGRTKLLQSSEVSSN